MPAGRNDGLAEVDERVRLQLGLDAWPQHNRGPFLIDGSDKQILSEI